MAAPEAMPGFPTAASTAALLGMDSWLSDKYAEGTVGSHFYADREYVDKVEAIAARHARALFGANHAYVQPHSGIDANLVAFWTILARRVEGPALAAFSPASSGPVRCAGRRPLARTALPFHTLERPACLI